MAKIVIDQEKCKGCLLCINCCAQGLISIEKTFNKQGIKPVKFKDNSECAGCMLCAIICPDCCIEVYK